MLEELLYISILTTIFILLLEVSTRLIRYLTTKSIFYENAKTETGNAVRNKTNGFIFKIFRWSSTLAIYFLAYATYHQATGVSGMVMFASFITFKIGSSQMRKRKNEKRKM